jgi:hypothetical protein
MAEKERAPVAARSNARFSRISENTMRNENEDFLDLFVQFTMILYMEDKLKSLLENKNIEKKWNDKLTRGFKRYVEELNA